MIMQQFYETEYEEASKKIVLPWQHTHRGYSNSWVHFFPFLFPFFALQPEVTISDAILSSLNLFSFLSCPTTQLTRCKGMVNIVSRMKIEINILCIVNDLLNLSLIVS